MSFFVPNLGHDLNQSKNLVKMNVEKHTTNNVGGICKLYYFLISDLLSLIPLAKNKVRVEIRSVSNFNEVKFTRDTANITETQKHDKDGDYTEFKLKLFCPGMSEQLLIELTPLLINRVGIIYQLNSGEWKTAGSKQEPIRILQTTDTGTKITDLKGITLESTRKFINPIPYTTDPTL